MVFPIGSMRELCSSRVLVIRSGMIQLLRGIRLRTSVPRLSTMLGFASRRLSIWRVVSRSARGHDDECDIDGESDTDHPDVYDQGAYESVGGHDKAGETHELVWPSLPVAGGNVTGRYGVVDMLSTTIQRW